VKAERLPLTRHEVRGCGLIAAITHEAGVKLAGLRQLGLWDAPQPESRRPK
jgi:hypothetical protein